MAKAAETPLMKQYNQFKSQHPDAILLFRVGDFYETFGEDAILTSQILGIVLTRRANGSASYIELAGFPHHSIDAPRNPVKRRSLRRISLRNRKRQPLSVWMCIRWTC